MDYGTGKKVLVVDDDRMNLKLLKAILEGNGCEAILAGDGAGGVRAARRELPDLILMDIRMPGMDGIEALRALKAKDSTRGIPVIALTSSAMRGDREWFLRMGFDDYISKPVDRKEFISLISTFLNEKKGR
jgi:two-component system cell cycle response regulator DivK